MFRTQALDEIGMYSMRFPAAEDYEFFYRFVDLGKVANLDEVLIQALDDPTGISQRRRRRQILSRMKIKLMHFDLMIHPG